MILTTLIFCYLVFALSLHAVFEGLAVGLEGRTEDVWTLFTGNKLVN